MSQPSDNYQESLALNSDNDLDEPPLYKVLLHNDDYTSMEFVVAILERIFQKNHEEATRIMLNVHQQGVGVAGVYTKDICETKIAVVHDLARRNEFPLRCSMEKA
ncbi:MAG: ATP-dependent Clp protease adapter ClpS [Desulfobulbaceae bacterium]|jgi:ATP-dependent Clp protease adaptor protein ClpS|nr:ATP-dependent Clp protease adapter ClpS [Desulfobulbaceae bacterium]